MPGTTVRKWLAATGFQRKRTPCSPEGTISSDELVAIKERAQRKRASTAQRSPGRLTTRHVSRVISRIGKAAGVIVDEGDPRTGRGVKYASAHDLRHTFAVRLKRSGMPPDLIQQLMRHADFRTTEKCYLCDTIQEDAGRIRTCNPRFRRPSELCFRFADACQSP